MQSDIYFSHETKRRSPGLKLMENMFGFICHSINFIAPALAVRAVRFMLSNPTGSARKGRLGNDFERFSLATPWGELQMYSIGSGPVIQCIHGWSGNASQLEKLMRKVAAQGFQVVGFDHFRHGESGGKDINYFLFIKATMLVRQYLQRHNRPVQAVIGHSVGGMASLHADKEKELPHLLLSPVVGVHARLRDSALSFGIPESILDAATASMEEDYAMCFSGTNEEDRLRENPSNVKLVHSNKDRVIPASRSAALRTSVPALDLDIGRFGGHTSILKVESVHENTIQWLHRCLNRDD